MATPTAAAPPESTALECDPNDIQSSQGEAVETAFAKFQSIVPPTRRRKRAYGTTSDDATTAKDGSDDARNEDKADPSLFMPLVQEENLDPMGLDDTSSLFGSEETEDESLFSGDAFSNEDNNNTEETLDEDAADTSSPHQEEVSTRETKDYDREASPKRGRSKRKFRGTGMRETTNATDIPTEKDQSNTENETGTETAEGQKIDEKRESSATQDDDIVDKRQDGPPSSVDSNHVKTEKEADPTAANKPSNSDSKTDAATATSPEESSSADLLREEVLFPCVDRLYIEADKDAVTVGDIVRSVEAELKVAVDKPTKKKIRNHLKDLITSEVQPVGVTSNASDVEEEVADQDEVSSQGEQEESSSEEEDEEEEVSEYEEEQEVAPKKTRKKRPTKLKKPSKSRSTTRPRRSKKPSAVKIHAEMLRKRRMEERRVRNEELQLQQNAEDQKRAEQIASRFETNTEELRLQRLEDRLDLLQKLNQKRIQVIAIDDTPEPEEEKSIENETPKDPVEESTDSIPMLESTEDSGSEEEESSDDEELELEIVGDPKASSEGTGNDNKSSKSTALSVLDFASRNPKATQKTKTATISFHSSTQQAQMFSPGKSASARAALRNTLLAKQRKAGNLWLARELGYKTEEEHVRDCLEAEEQKRQRVLKVEEKRLRANERKQLRERLFLQGEEAEEEEPEEQVLQSEEEEDEEMALAMEIENDQEPNKVGPGLGSDEDRNDDPADLEAEEKVAQETGSDAIRPLDDPDATNKDDESSVANEIPDLEVNDLDPPPEEKSDDDNTVTFEGPNTELNNEEVPQQLSLSKTTIEKGDADVFNDGEKHNETPDPIELDAVATASDMQPSTVTEHVETSNETKAQEKQNEESVLPDDGDSSSKLDVSSEEENVTASRSDLTQADSIKRVSKDSDPDDEGENEFGEETTELAKGEKPRNAAWKAMLQKEAEKLKKLKKRKGGLVEEEADEEEEEEVAGLEDFGFSVRKKKKSDDEEDAGSDKLDEEDLENIVDEVSDNEGDEEAGEAARKALEHKEEKERHKEILRRMRDGYDGRRGGIAGTGVAARGIHRFDQLVAADNRDDAKRLGLLNDDELDSDDEAGQNKQGGDDGNGEIEDETALLDKMLKDRFLHRSSVDLEENFSEDEDNDEDTNENDDNAVADDEEEKEQERLAKRFAKRARMQRLIETHGDDKEFSQLRLIDEDESMKLELMKIKNVSSRANRQSSVSSSITSVSGGSDSQNHHDSFGSDTTKKSRDKNTLGSLLSNGGKLSLALQASRRSKRKTSFLGGAGKSGKEAIASIHKSVALSHVVFHTGESQLSKTSTSFASSKKSMRTGKRKRTSFQASTSLWSKVSANEFKKKGRH